MSPGLRKFQENILWLTSKNSSKSIRCFDQRTQIPRLHDRMARIGRDVKFRFRPRAMQIPRAGHRANNVVSALHNHAGYLTNLPDVFNQIILARKETVVREVMTLDASKCLRKSWISKPFDRLGIKEKF